MKKLLMVLLTLSSVSAFAGTCVFESWNYGKWNIQCTYVLPLGSIDSRSSNTKALAQFNELARNEGYKLINATGNEERIVYIYSDK